jgi:hypothetical protein
MTIRIELYKNKNHCKGLKHKNNLVIQTSQNEINQKNLLFQIRIQVN